MSNYNQDDFFSKLIEDMDNWDDDDLMLLDAEDGAVSTPAASKAGQTTQKRTSTHEYTPAGESGQTPSRKKKGAPVALIVVLIILIAIVGGALVALKMTDGDLTRLMFWKSESVVVSNSGSTQEDSEEVAEAEEAEAEEEVEVEEEEIIDSEQVEVEEEDAEEEAVTVSLTGLALLDLWGEDFTPNLVGVNNVGGAQADISNGQLDYTAATYLEQFIAAARNVGYNTICTIYGKYVAASEDATQEELEHATGLAVDLIDVQNQVPAALESDSSLAEEIAWWAEHAAEYGFILRYPADKEEITGQPYCCYHFVYVTVSVAQEMAENNWCLEEYLEEH